MPKKLTIEEMQELATERGGICLSATYINSTSKLRWQCAERHQWEATPHHIKQGEWCPTCASHHRVDHVRLGIDAMQRLASDRGGRCLSTTYTNSQAVLIWECAEGHQWRASPDALQQGGWCPFCANIHRREALSLTLDEMHHIAEDRGGQCLSDRYINNSTPLLWKCAEGHQWEARPSSIKQGSWCPVCAIEQPPARIPGRLEDMQRIAADRGGKCLSILYVNNKTKLRWECREGHQWDATPNTIKSKGSWCPVCGGTAKSTLADMHRIAAERGGTCVSTEYRHDKWKLVWECAGGHRWPATPNQIKQGRWCPTCANITRAERLKGSLEEMRAIADGHGGNAYLRSTSIITPSSCGSVPMDISG